MKFSSWVDEKLPKNFPKVFTYLGKPELSKIIKSYESSANFRPAKI